MLMKTENMPIEKVSEEYSHCQDLLDYIDGPFQERIERGQICWFDTLNKCGTQGCLLGWFAIDSNHIELISAKGAEYPGDGYDASATEKYFGLNRSSRHAVFGINPKASKHRAALIEHMASL